MRVGRMLVFVFLSLLAANPAAAQKRGGTLKLYHNDTPPSTSPVV